MTWFVFLCSLLTAVGVVSPANAQEKTTPVNSVKQVPVRTTTATVPPPTTAVPATPRTTRGVPAPAAAPVRGGRTYGAVPLLHLPGLGNTTYLPSGVTTRSLKAGRTMTTLRQKNNTKVQIGNVAPFDVNEQVVNLTVASTVPDVRTPFWTSDEKNLFYSSNQDPTTLGTSNSNQIAANGRHHIFEISSSIPATISTVSTPIAITNPTDPDDYLYPAVNAIGNYITFIRSSDGKSLTDATKTWVLCYAPVPVAGTYIDPAATTIVGGSTVTFPNAAGSVVPFANVQRPTWLGSSNIIVSALLTGDSTYHLFQVNLQPTAGQSIIFQLTAGPADERNPAVSPDGKVVAFDSTALPSFGAVGTGSEAYGAAGVPRQVAFPTNIPTTALAVNLTNSAGTINRNVYTMNLVGVNDPANAGQTLAAYTIRQFTERFTGALDFDNEEPAWSSLNNNAFSNPGGTTTQAEYIAFSSTRNITFASGDTTDTVVTGYTQGTLHHIYYVESTINGGATTIPEGPIGNTAVNQLPHQALYLNTGDSVTTPQFDDRYPTWSPFATSFRIGFQSDRNGDYYSDNFDGYVATGATTNPFRVTNGRDSLLVATVIDVTAPTLLRFDLNNQTGEVLHINIVKNANEPFDPTTSARNSDDGIVPGTTIHIAARVEDRESGLRPDKAVFVQIKNPNSKYQGMAQGSTNPAEHKEYVDEAYTLYEGPPPGAVEYGAGIAVPVPGSTTAFSYGPALIYGTEFEAEALGATNNITTVGGVTVNTGTMGSAYFGHQVYPPVIGFGGLGSQAGSSSDNLALYEAGLQDQGAYSGSTIPPLDGTNGQAAVWLELKPLFHFDPTTGNPVLNASGNPVPWLPADLGSNQPPGGVLYGASLVLPQEPSDWYMDVILYDNAVDPFDPTLSSNAIIYDNVWGFSSAPPLAPQTADILFVADYTLPQKFFSSRINSSSPAAQSDNLLPIFFGAESYYTDVAANKLFPSGKDNAAPPTSTGTPPSPLTWSPRGPFLLTQPGLPAGSVGGGVSSGVPNVLGVGSYDDEELLPFSTLVDGKELPTVGRYSIWRILSRGPVPTNIFNAYLPVAGTEPPDTFTNPATSQPFQTGAQPIENAQRMIVWSAPFSGDVFPCEGTILDTSTQNNLQNFVGAGGRLFISGQDIAFALTSNGAATSTFLTNVLQATFNADTSAVGSITAAASVGSGYTQRIQNDAWSRADHAYGQWTGTYWTYFTPASGADELTENAATSGGDAALTVGGDVGSDDVVTATPTTPISATVLTPSAYAVFNHAAAQGMIESNYLLGTAVFSSVGFETISQGWYTYTMTGAPLTFMATHAIRSEIMHNIVCSLRSGSITGQVIDTNGAPVAGALVRAVSSAAGEATLAAGTATTDAGGNFHMLGVQPDVYTVFAYKNGFYSQHSSLGSMHGTGVFNINVVVKPGNPGSLSGFKITAAPAGNSGGVFASDGKTPLQGVTVQARQIDLTNGVYDIVAASTTSAADGSYSLPSLPIGKYVVVANPVDQNKNYNSNLSTVQLTATPNAGFSLGSGETVNADNTITIAENQSFFANFFLTASPQAVSGQVLNSATGNAPIAGATVTAVVTGTTTVVATATTDSSGNYSLSYTAGLTPTTLLPAASYTVTATKLGFSSASVTVTVGGSSSTIVTAPTIFLTVLPPGSVYGLVQVSVSGQTTTAAAAGSTVSLYPINSAGQPDTTQTPLTATVSSTVSQATVAGIDDTSTATVPVINSGVSISYNFTIANVPGANSPGVTYIAILTPPAGSGLAADPAQLKVVVESSTVTYNANFTLEPPHTYAGGLQLVALPGDYSAVSSTAGIFGLSAATDPTDYNAFNVAEWTGNAYSESPTIKPQASKGYFMRFNSAAGIVEAGAPISSSSYTISLTTGWNLIGNPFTDQTNPTSAAAGIDLSNSALATYSYTTTGGVTQNHVPLSQAISDNAVGGSAFYYTGSANGSEYIEATVLTGYLGYWFEAFVPVQVTLTYPGSSSSKSAKISASGPVAVNGTYQTLTRAQVYAPPAARTITSKGLTDWRQQLSIRQGEYTDTDNSIGVSGDTRAVWDNRYDTQKPPVDQNVPGVTLSILGTGPTGKAASLADSVVGTGSSVKTWSVSVASVANSTQPVTIYWPNIDRLPRGIQPVLVDLSTGHRVSMTGSSSYQFKPSGKSAALFQIQVAPPVSLPLDIINLRSTKVRTAASTAFHFSFVVTRNADITSQVQTLSGKTIRNLTTRAQSTVESSIVWDGRNDLGAEVGPGPLVLTVRAVDENGNQFERKVMFMKL